MGNTYDDSACKTPQSFIGVITHAAATMTNAQSYSVDITQASIDDVIMTPSSAAMTKILNDAKACSKSWTAGIPTSVMGTDCAQIPETKVAITLSQDLKTMTSVSCYRQPGATADTCDTATFHKQ